ncbi:DSD1 family PLP-dependent enzyme [uncultured Marinobacter sp.]|uniref:DSD1 family PLP-dependent enzyme n=1 Tax=uncultured Marinobacter sp. TaxID=187379 RepID=UPI00261D86E1|nr:DSD1 family PLP-dependent enzyme [uncultured Marinobacter sp.]
MNRRGFLFTGLLGGAAIMTGAGLLRPADKGKPYTAYFQALNAELKRAGPMRPVLVVDLDRLDHNIDVVKASLQRSGKALRLVEKSLPARGLLEYIASRTGTDKLMSFHQPFLNQTAEYFPQADILLGKPLPARSVEVFYQQHQGQADPTARIQWLIDAPERLQEYLQISRARNSKFRINIELDVGLHRGGVTDNDTLNVLLGLIANNPEHLEFSGFMGYDPFVGMELPSVLGSPETLLGKVMTRYQGFVDFTRNQYPALWRDGLALNTAGSPSYRLHETETLSTELAVGSAMVMPTHFDLPSLSDHVPAAFIASPVLKSTGPVNIPALDGKSKIFSWWDINQRATYFIYGGNWLADFVAPEGLQSNSLYGRSSNQELVTASPGVGLQVNDQVFLRPQQSEAVLLQFGDILAMRNGKIVDQWPVYQDGSRA